MNQSDHSEARERARQEFEALLKTACRYCGSDYSGPDHLAYKSPEEGSLRWLAYAAFSLGRRSLEQERWVSVEERLPDFRVPVIVHGGVAELRIDGWWTYMECPMRCIQWKVTHWQPLPAPPVHKGDS